MKKNFLTFGLALLGFVACVPARAAIYSPQSFLTQNADGMILPSLTTNTYYTTNVVTYQNLNHLPLSIGANDVIAAFSTNLPFSSQTTIGGSSSLNITAYGASIGFWNPLLSTNFGTNLCFVEHFSGTNVTTTNAYTTNTLVGPSAVQDVAIFADSNGNVNTNCAITITCTGDKGGTATNTVSFQFLSTAEPDTSLNYSSLAQQTLTVSFQLTSTNTVTYVTNPPAAFIQGCRKIRLNTWSATTNSAANVTTNIYVNSIKFSGFKP